MLLKKKKVTQSHNHWELQTSDKSTTKDEHSQDENNEKRWNTPGKLQRNVQWLRHGRYTMTSLRAKEHGGDTNYQLTRGNKKAPSKKEEQWTSRCKYRRLNIK